MNLREIKSNYWAISGSIYYWIFNLHFDWVLGKKLRIFNIRQKNWELSSIIRNIYINPFTRWSVYSFQYMPSYINYSYLFCVSYRSIVAMASISIPWFGIRISRQNKQNLHSRLHGFLLFLWCTEDEYEHRGISETIYSSMGLVGETVNASAGWG